jgi:gliding motility-associated-like protein
MKKYLFIIVLSLIVSVANAQLQVSNILTPAQLVQNMLAGQGVQISNVQFNGAPGNTINEQIGKFIGTASNIGIDSGLVLCTGDIQLAVGPNNAEGTTLGGNNFGASDPDLDILATNTTNDRAVLEFDFIPAGNDITFRYVFGSEEYNEYVCSGFNDVFGFFISGPGFNGPFQLQAENIAIIPNTSTPVAINTINNGTAGFAGDPATCAAIDPLWNTHTALYVDNAGGTSVQFDGFTVVMEAKAVVQCNETYHLKLALADAGDAAFDSGVFLEAGSLQSEALEISAITTTGDTLMVEGCNSAIYVFNRPTANDTAFIDIGVFGTATMGVDYSNIPSQILMPPGVFSDTVSITSNFDFIPEGTETITLAIYFSNACDGDSATASLYLLDYDSLQVDLFEDTVICSVNGEQASLYVNVSGGLPDYLYTWTNLTDTVDSVVVSPPTDTEYYVTVLDACGYSKVSDIVKVTVQCPIIVPNVMSLHPDSPNGVFNIVNITQYPENEVYIYNRWGRLVFSKTNYQNDWDGGNLVEGVYFYVVTNNIEEPLAGTLHIFK